jgi:F0F1-type ATP synthase membrane subunit c/vacuolar-type H+-ATPase subunit K
MDGRFLRLLVGIVLGTVAAFGSAVSMGFASHPFPTGVAATPEPRTYAMIGTGIILLGMCRRRNATK